jgi:hypothetical protein
VLAIVVLRGTAGNVVSFVAMMVFLGACVRGVALAVGDDPERARQLMRGGIIGL